VSRLSFTDLPLAGLKLVTRQPMGDSRGFLSRIFCADELALAGWNGPVAQVNHTYTARAGTVRGMHYQRPPHAEMKLVSCIHGAVWDVVVDLRAGSPSFLRWHAERLSAEQATAMLVPEGFAHGFQTLTENVEMIYCHSAAYNADAEAGLKPQDPKLAIAWPLPISDLSQRDAGHSLLTESFTGIVS
jgi:dTDP-4-dehydrorhamnose 3,5-epimerase